MKELTIVEKVAKALWEVEGVAYGWNDNERRTISWEEASERNLEGARVFRIFARAAIEALMEPTESMLDAGDAADGYDVYVGVWNAMIQAALKEGGQ